MVTYKKNDLNKNYMADSTDTDTELLDFQSRNTYCTKCGYRKPRRMNFYHNNKCYGSFYIINGMFFLALAITHIWVTYRTPFNPDQQQVYQYVIAGILILISILQFVSLLAVDPYHITITTVV